MLDNCGMRHGYHLCYVTYFRFWHTLPFVGFLCIALSAYSIPRLVEWSQTNNHVSCRVMIQIAANTWPVSSIYGCARPDGRYAPGLLFSTHHDVIKRKKFPRYYPFVRGIHRSAVNFPHKGQWRGALMFSLICVWTNGWVNSQDAVGDLRYHRSHYDVIVMFSACHALEMIYDAL